MLLEGAQIMNIQFGRVIYPVVKRADGKPFEERAWLRAEQFVYAELEKQTDVAVIDGITAGGKPVPKEQKFAILDNYWLTGKDAKKYNLLNNPLKSLSGWLFSKYGDTINLWFFLAVPDAGVKRLQNRMIKNYQQKMQPVEFLVADGEDQEFKLVKNGLNKQ